MHAVCLLRPGKKLAFAELGTVVFDAVLICMRIFRSGVQQSVVDGLTFIVPLLS
jgi:hypothetical protein